MKKIRLIVLALVGAMVTQGALSFAAETGTGLDWLKLGNRLRLEYDDNIYQRERDETDSFKIINEITLGVTLDFEPTFITFRYRPSFIWWSDREPDDTDFHHDIDFVLNHRFSPRLSFGLKNTFRLAEQPEEIDRGVTIRENDDFMYNVTDANIDFLALPRTHFVLGGRYTLLSYDRDAVSDTEDYEIWAVGLTIRHRLTELTTVMADYRREDITYDNLDDRGSESDFIGLGLEHIIGASFVASARGGYQNKDFKDSELGDESEPYADATLTYIFSPRTRISLGGGYSMFEADVYPYASQNRTIVFASVAHDLSAKLSLYLSASHQNSDYSAEQSISGSVPAEGGDENVAQGSVRVAYRLDARNTLELNYQYMDLDSDLREDFDRTRVSIGWRLDI